ncbi:MAG: CDP-diacylglycerol--serine O-phosphatidyltransferase [Candidatus Marinimicrobia bacterium]|nr:CDP-diacylglycerol--serine O-phosphatidyltransferase [Candidatus Neomarinimicrobiota bacterium]MCF7829704.1 CDP-diacylglycerol--serine O-phosphatidyltransferase [Candidatus Neomarinimicrobiota bacterium]MCF7881654.1 CDP-diacylglycerol--serine O-phosphatidyltransferase [Candidatus Neomarinimicrobiota bacterium]
MKFRKAMFPSILTLFNMFAGFLAIIQVFHEQYHIAIWLIFFAAVFDGLDGKLARLLGSSSEFGIEFDSMADLVSFCIAPSFFIYRLYTVDLGVLGAILAFFPLMFGSIRLARFNIQKAEEPHPFFVGLPTPAAALSIIAFPLFYSAVGTWPGEAKVMLPYIIVLSFLMVSHVPYMKMPKWTFNAGKMNTVRVIGLLISVIALIIAPRRALLILALLFNLNGILRWMAGSEQVDKIIEPLTK